MFVKIQMILRMKTSISNNRISRLNKVTLFISTSVLKILNTFSLIVTGPLKTRVTKSLMSTRFYLMMVPKNNINLNGSWWDSNKAPVKICKSRNGRTVELYKCKTSLCLNKIWTSFINIHLSIHQFQLINSVPSLKKQKLKKQETMIASGFAIIACRNFEQTKSIVANL